MGSNDPGEAAPRAPAASRSGPIRASVAVGVAVAVGVVAWMALTGVLVGVGELVVRSGTVQRFDDHVTAIVVEHRSAGLDAAMKAVTWLGSWVAVLVAAAVILLLVLRRMISGGSLLLALVLWGGSQGATSLAKRVVGRPRPPEHLRLVATHGWSWPSGHTATATLVFAVLAAVVWSLTPRAGPRTFAVLASIVAVVLVAFSRVELGVHWTTDVMASALFVTAWLSVGRAAFGDLARLGTGRAVGSRAGRAAIPGGSANVDAGDGP